MARRAPKNTAPAAPSLPPAGALPLRTCRRLLGLLMLLFLLLAGAYNAVTPAATADQHNPDENAHLLNVEAVAAGHLPRFQPGQPDYEAHQPPLYYILCAPVYLAARGGGEAVAMRAVRCVSTLLGVLLIAAVFRCILTLFPEEPLLALGTAAFVALLPMNLALSASVTNDSLTNLALAAGMWLGAQLAMAGPPPVDQVLRDRRVLLLGVVLGAGVLTKTSTLVLFPAAGLLFALLARAGLWDRAAMRAAGLSLGLGLLIGAPWLLRNQVLYGDPVAQHIFVSSFQNTARADDMLPWFGSVSAYLGAVAQWTFASFWGVFDSMRLFWGRGPHAHSPSPKDLLGWIYGLLAALGVLSVIGLIRLSRTRPLWLSARQRVVLGVFAGLVALTGLVFLRFVLVFFQAQGRYWYPALLPLAFFFVLGWRGLLSNPAGFRAALGALALGLLALNLYTLFGLLLPRFHP